MKRNKTSLESSNREYATNIAPKIISFNYIRTLLINEFSYRIAENNNRKIRPIRTKESISHIEIPEDPKEVADARRIIEEDKFHELIYRYFICHAWISNYFPSPDNFTNIYFPIIKENLLESLVNKIREN